MSDVYGRTGVMPGRAFKGARSNTPGLSLEFNVDSVLKMFAGMSTKNQKKVHRDALKMSCSVLQKQTQANVRKLFGSHANSKRRTGKTLPSGVKISVDRDAKSAKVHILGDFRLQWFELGTPVRTTKKGKNKMNRGYIQAHYFFKAARQQAGKEASTAVHDLIAKAILKNSKR